jgi:hypothetical protein
VEHLGVQVMAAASPSAGVGERLAAPRLMTVQAVAVPAALSAATFLAATPWLRAYAVAGATPVFVVASVASVLIASLATSVWRLPATVSYAVSAVALVILLIASAGLHPDAIGRGLVNGPNELLTETLPLTGSRAGLAAPLVLTWLCGTGAAELVTRSPRRQPGVAGIGLAIPLAAYVVAYAVTSSRPGRNDVVAPLLLLTLVAVALLRQAVRLSLTRRAEVGAALEDGARTPHWRASLAGGLIAALVASVVAVVIPSLPGIATRPASLNRAAPLTNSVVTDPVDTMAALRNSSPDSSARPVLRIRTDDPSTGYLAAAILDDYDGALWSFASTFRPTGGRIPLASGRADNAAVIGAHVIQQQETLLRPLPIPMLPALDRPVAIGGVSAVADSSTGMILPGHTLKAGRGFTVSSRAPASTMAALSGAEGIGVPPGQLVGNGGVSADLAIPANSSAAMTTALRFMSNLTGERPAPSVAFLQAVMSALHTYERRIDPTLTKPTSVSPLAATIGRRGTPTSTTTVPVGLKAGGTSLSEVIDAVTFDQSATPEQFATFFAMVARSLGVPARVVTGFRLVDSSRAGSVPAGTYQVTNRSAWTWVEIPVVGGGWVVADPAPDTPTAASAPPPLRVQVTPTTMAPPQANAVPRSEIAGAHALAKPAHINVPRSHHVSRWVSALLAVAVIGVALLLAGPGLAGLRRLVRRRVRRRRSDPSELAVGAWLELLDGLHQAGLSPPRGATSTEVAADAGRAFGPDVATPVRQVGELADRAVFSVSHPPGLADAEEAWREQRRVRRSVLRSLDRRQRTRALLSVGPAQRHPFRGER